MHPLNNNLVQAVVYYSGGGILRSEQGGAIGSWTLMDKIDNNNPPDTFDHWGLTAIAADPTESGERL